MGGLSVSLGLGPHKALLNDSNPHLVNMYRQLRDGLRVTVEFLNDKETFYAYRARFNQRVRAGEAQTPEGAQLFYYLNRTGFNGLCRFNSKGEFNVPMGRYATIDYEDTVSFRRYRQILTGWDFMDAGDFSDVRVAAEDFIYADPPYDAAFTGYDKHGFSWADQQRLAEHLAKHRGPVVASNHSTERITSLYHDLGFTVHILDAPRRINCTGDRSPAPEMLATHNLPCSATDQKETCSHCNLTLHGTPD